MEGKMNEKVLHEPIGLCLKSRRLNKEGRLYKVYDSNKVCNFEKQYILFIDYILSIAVV